MKRDSIISTETIRFWNFQPISTGGFSCNCNSTKFGRNDHLEFALSPNPGEVAPDAIAIALSTLCGSSYGKIDIELNVSEQCAKAVEGYTHAFVSFSGTKAIYRPAEPSAVNFALNFSGGFDSLAAYSLMPNDLTRLVSIDWGGHFFREELFFRRFNPYTLKTNIQRLGYCRETWTFMGIAMILFAQSLDIAYGVFGGTFENTIGQMMRCPRIAYEFQTAPFSSLGIKDMRVTHALTEIGSIMTVMRHSPSVFKDSLKSVAAPGTEKAYRKFLLSYIVNKKFGYGIDIPVQNEPLKAPYKFGDNMTIDMLSIYEMKNVGRKIASKTVLGIPEEMEDFVSGLNLSFYERWNTNFMESIPSSCQDYYVSQLTKAGIRPYDEEDWYEIDAVCKFLSRWYGEFKKRNDNASVGHPKSNELVDVPSDFSLEAKPGPYNWTPVTMSLVKSRRYELFIGRIKVEAGKTTQVCVRLYDMQKKTGTAGRFFSLGRDQSASNLKWSFETPNVDGDYRVIAYAGVPGKCDGVGVSYRDVRVS